MILEKVDDCISEIKYENRDTLYTNNHHESDCDPLIIGDNPLIEAIPYELGKKIYVYLKDLHGECGVSMTVYINEYIIKTESQKFWKCEDCSTDDKNYFYNYDKNRLDCFDGGRGHDVEVMFFQFYFKLDSLTNLINGGNGINKFPYYLTDQNKFFFM